MWSAPRVSRMLQHAMRQLKPSVPLPAAATSAPALRPLAASALPSASSASAASLFARTFATSRIVVPQLGDSIAEGTLAEVVLSEGSGVRVDDVVGRLDTDKVSVDLRSDVEGRIARWLVKQGDSVRPGDTLLEVEVGAAGSATAGHTGVKPAAPGLQPASKPHTEDGRQKQAAPMARGGTQSPVSIHPADPHASHARVPLIAFRYGKRAPRAAGAAQPTQNNQPAPVVAEEWMGANEAAAKAWEELPLRYKRKPLKDAQLAMIELGGAPDYELKKKSRA